MLDESIPKPSDERPEESASDDIYPTAPPTERTAEPEPLISADLTRLDPPRPDPKRFQFSLQEMLILITVFAAGLGLLGLIPGGYSSPHAAGLTGVAVLLGLIVLGVLKTDRMILHVAWWALLLAYVAASVAAMLWGG